MEHGKYVSKIAYITVVTAVIALSLSAATYAWFSSNSVVQTNFVSGRTDKDTVELQISSAGGSSFKGEEKAPVTQVNSYSATELLPVSTADLSNFVYSAGTVQDAAVHFEKVEKERYYYHGRVYLQAVAENHTQNSKLALYLDTAADNGGEMFQNMKGYMANAARLGLTFDGGQAKILRVSEDHNPTQNRVMNTVLNGTQLKDGQVIDSAGSTLKATADPSEAIADYTVGAEGLVDSSQKELFTMELNQIYTVDIYFSMEGCDPDCSEITQLDELDMHLAFYGVLIEG